MRKQILRISLSVIIAISAGVVFNSCGAEDAIKPNCNTTADYCDSGKDLETCCTTTKCYYKWDGNRYDCNGTDCVSAASELVDDACVFGTEDVNALVALSADLVKQSAN